MRVGEREGEKRTDYNRESQTSGLQKNNNLFSASTNSTHKLTYRDGLLLLYLVLEQELWFAGDINDSKKEVHHNIDEKCIVHGT